MHILDPENDWQTLLSYLPADYEALAVAHKQLNTQWSNAKIASAAVLLRFIFLHVGANLPLRQTVSVMAKGGGPKISPVRLHYKMRHAQPFLAALVGRMASDLQREAVPERWGGYEMVCVDGSSISGPGSDGTDVRLHVVLRLSDLRVLDTHITSVSEGETLRRFSWNEGQLVIADRGYSNPPGVAWVVEHGADVLVRLNRSSLPVFDEDDEKGDDGPQIDVLAWCRELRGHRATERPAIVTHREGARKVRKVRGRLIGFRLPEVQAEEARERTRREYGSSLTEEHLEAAAYVLLFTTAPAARLTAARCVEAYRLRWQVELQLKRWKSICHFDKLPNYRDDTMLSWVTAKVLLGLLLDSIGSAQLASPPGTNRSTRVLAREPWKMTSVIWPMILSAIMPLRLSDFIPQMPDMTERLEAMTDHVDDRQVARFRNNYYPRLRRVAEAAQIC
jgi:hypothetical protein